MTHQITCIYCHDTIFVNQDRVRNNLSLNLWKFVDWGSGVCPKCSKTLKEQEITQRVDK